MPWQKLASDTLTVDGDKMDTETFDAKKFLQVIASIYSSSTTLVQHEWTFNNDNTSKYAERSSGDGGAEITAINQSEILFPSTFNNRNAGFWIMYIFNLSAEEKLVIGHVVLADAAGAGNDPRREERVAKYIPSAQITQIESDNVLGGVDYDTDSNLSVLGTG